MSWRYARKVVCFKHSVNWASRWISKYDPNRPRVAQRDAYFAHESSQARSMLLLFSGHESEISLP
jgi:hypothetical protein